MYLPKTVRIRFRNGVLRKRGGGSVVVWAGIAHDFRTNLVDIEWNLSAQRYRDGILARLIIPSFQTNTNITLFQHDNDTSHTTRDTEFPQGK